jgi:gliding motility-associated-like protein
MPLPIPSITANTNTLCLNQKLILQGFGGTSYYWLLPNNSILTSQTMSLIAYNSMYSGTYTLIVTDAYACVNSTTKKIKVENLPSGYLIYNNGLNNCVPFCNNYTFVPSGVTTTLSSIIQQFNWQINNQSVSSQNTFSYCFINAGTYIVKGDLTSDLGCTNSVTMQIIGYPKPLADFNYSPKHPIENMEEVTFVSSGKDQNIKNFNWIFMYNKTEFSSNQINPSFLFENAGTYSVALILTNEYECKDTVIKTIRVASDFAVYVPNSFTPNEDKKNETFNAVTRGVKIYSLFVFDRWGHQIFETTDLNTGWDGTFKGQLCPSDIYVWKIYATSTEGEFKELTGHLMLYP